MADAIKNSYEGYLAAKRWVSFFFRLSSFPRLQAVQVKSSGAVPYSEERYDDVEGRTGVESRSRIGEGGELGERDGERAENSFSELLRRGESNYAPVSLSSTSRPRLPGHFHPTRPIRPLRSSSSRRNSSFSALSDGWRLRFLFPDIVEAGVLALAA